MNMQVWKNKRMKENFKEYNRLKCDKNYFNVAYNKDNGGLMATHIEHNFDPEKGIYEKDVQRIGFQKGNAVILESETGKAIGERYTEGTWNGKLFEIVAAETGTSNNILKGLKHCASKRNTEIAIIYFPNKNFNILSFNNAIVRYKGLEKLNDTQFVKFHKIFVVENENILTYNL